MQATASMGQAQEANGKASNSSKTFRLETSVSIHIKSTPEKIWNIMTKAEDFPKWNSTIISLDGKIALKEKIKLVSYLDPKRVFNIKVSKMEPYTKMVWSDGFAPMFRGIRTFTFTPQPDGSTIFTMTEVMTGAMLPMIKGSLPDFRESFERFATDLKTEAEKN